MPIRLKAIIFDYGNVISEPQNAAEIQGMASMIKLPLDEFSKAYWTFREEYDEAKLEPQEYWLRVAKLAGRALAAPDIEKLIYLDSRSWMYPRRAIVEWAQAIRNKSLRTAVLSNMPVTLRDALETCNWMPAFDHRTFSCNLGISKPSSEIYIHCLRGLGLAPADVLFLDDREPNVDAARELGMHAIRFTTPLEAARQMEVSFDIAVPLVATVRTGDEKDN